MLGLDHVSSYWNADCGVSVYGRAASHGLSRASGLGTTVRVHGPLIIALSVVSDAVAVKEVQPVH